MNATAVAAIGVAGSAFLLLVLYLVLQVNAIRNERVLNTAITAMSSSLQAEPAPQRELLRSVADTLIAQDRVTARVETAVHELAMGDRRSAAQPAVDLLDELLGLPEPQVLVTEFLDQYSGDRGTGTAFGTVRASLVQAAIAEVFADVAREQPVEFAKLSDIGADGEVRKVALAVLDDMQATDRPPLRVPLRAPRVSDLDSRALSDIAKALTGATVRQLRLATLLHGQAEALLRIQRKELRGLAKFRAGVHQVLKLPLIRRPEFTADDLSMLVVTFDSVGEVIDAAGEQLARGEPARAIALLAGVRLPVPAGLPGRIYHQESLAQSRPVAAFGVWHRLAVTRWLAACAAAVSQGLAQSYWFDESPLEGSELEGSERDLFDAELALNASYS